VTNTNIYAANSRTQKPTSVTWNKLTKPVLLRYLVFLIYRGLFPSGRMADYFKNEATTGGLNKWVPSHPISNHISSHQVRQLKRYLHISDPRDPGDSTFYHKVQPLLRHVQEVSRAYYVPKTNVSIDEMIIRFSGRSKHTVRIKGKPTPEGYRILALCDSGYTYAFLPESRIGSNAELPTPHQPLPKDFKLNQTSRKVMHLVDQLPTNNPRMFNVYMDNFFSNIPLFHNMKLRGIGACGTARTGTAMFPKELKKKDAKLEPGAKGAVIVKDVLALLWVDNGPVVMLTTLHSLHSEEWMVQRMRRRPRAHDKNKAIQEMYDGKSRKMLSIPRVVDDYNHNMGGVDTADQLRQYYTAQMRTSRTWVPLFLWLLDTSIINAYIMWTTYHESKSKTSHRDYRVRLLDELLELSYKLEKLERLEAGNNDTTGNRPPLKRSRSNTYITTNNNMLKKQRLEPAMHFPIHKDEGEDSDKENRPSQTNFNNLTSRLQCVWCRHKSLEAGEKTRIKSKSSWECATCKVRLCLTQGRNCLQSYHTSG
jgi:hypothetical protein